MTHSDRSRFEGRVPNGCFTLVSRRKGDDRADIPTPLSPPAKKGKNMDDLQREMIDRDLASPQFVSWTARREAKHLLDVVRHLFPDNEALVNIAELSWEMICTIDDAIEGWMT